MDVGRVTRISEFVGKQKQLKCPNRNTSTMKRYAAERNSTNLNGGGADILFL